MSSRDDASKRLHHNAREMQRARKLTETFADLKLTLEAQGRMFSRVDKLTIIQCAVQQLQLLYEVLSEEQIQALAAGYSASDVDGGFKADEEANPYSDADDFMRLHGGHAHDSGASVSVTGGGASEPHPSPRKRKRSAVDELAIVGPERTGSALSMLPNSFFAHLFEHTELAQCILDPSLRVVAANAQFVQVLGFESGYPAGLSAQGLRPFLSLVDDADQSGAATALHTVLQGARRGQRSHYVGCTLVRTDGERFQDIGNLVIAHVPSGGMYPEVLHITLGPSVQAKRASEFTQPLQTSSGTDSVGVRGL